MPKIRIFLLIIFVVFGFFIFGKAEAGIEHNVSGWAWSENIGWISFNNTTGGGTTNYGVNINPSTGVFSGYAWSENIGWITFNESELSGCPSGTCQAKLDFGTKQVSGWAKALTDGGGWDGWIKLKGTNYGVWLDTSVTPNEFRDWAWSDMVIGWISFNCKNQNVCSTSSYKVVYGAADVTPPTVSVIADPASATTTWQNTDATATVSCSDTGTGCDTGSYKLKTYASTSTTCSTNYGDYTLTSPQTISSHLWVCGAAKDLAGNAGFSSPVEFKVDKFAPSTNFVSPTPNEDSWQKNDFTAKIMDSDTGDSGLRGDNGCRYRIIDINRGTIASSTRPCGEYSFNVPVGTSTLECQEDRVAPIGQSTCRAESTAYDNAGNAATKSRDFKVDYTPPAIGKIACATPPTSCDPSLAPCTTAQQGIEKTFCATLTDPVGKITGCQLWVDGANSGVSTTISPVPCENGASCSVSANYTFTSSGSHTMKFYCWDAAGNSDFGQSVTVNVGANQAPIITGGPSYTTSPCTSPTTQPGCNVNFTVSATDSDGDPLTYNWDFGDGATSTEQNPVHHYSTANTYTVTVTVSDGRGGAASGNLIITVSSPTLLADGCAGLDAALACYDSPTFSKPANGVDLKATVSGTMYGTINYKFDCTNNGSWEREVNNTTTNPYTAVDLCDYTATGTYVAKVHVDRGTGSAEDTITINVIENQPPTLSWTGETNYISDGLHPESGDSSTTFVYKIKYADPDGDAPNYVRVHIKKGGVDISGSPFNMSCPAGDYVAGVNCSFSKSGLSGGSDYTYFFEAQDNKGLNATPTLEKDAPDVNNPPTAAISCDATNCGPGSACNTNWITYNGPNVDYRINNTSTDPDNNIVRSTWWILGYQGTPWKNCEIPGDPVYHPLCDMGRMPSISSGNYTIKLEVADAGGVTSTADHSITVRQEAIAAFECSLKPGEGWKSCDNFRVSEDVLVYFRSVNGTLLSRPSEGASSITGFSWTFEDGTPATGTLQNPSVKFKKVDANSGLVTLKITDDVGRTDTTSHQLQITIPLPEWREVPPL